MRPFKLACRDCTWTQTVTAPSMLHAEAIADDHIRGLHHGSAEADVTPMPEPAVRLIDRLLRARRPRVVVS